jgi:chemotaxis protein CheC
MTDAEGVVLTELETDALTELVNLGISRAALALREMVGEQVFLSVPGVDLVSRQRAVEILAERATNKLVAVHEVFQGELTGRALLIFPEAQSLDLVRAVVGSDLSTDDLVDLETEALAEVGNIVLNGCLSTLANMLQRNLKTSLPEVLRGAPADILSLNPPAMAGAMLLFLYINFTLQQRDVNGYIAMIMDVPSLNALRDLLNEFIERQAGDLSVQSSSSA